MRSSRVVVCSLASVPPKKADEGKDKDKEKDAAEAALSQEARLANAVRDTKAGPGRISLYLHTVYVSVAAPLTWGMSYPAVHAN